MNKPRLKLNRLRDATKVAGLPDEDPISLHPDMLFRLEDRNRIRDYYKKCIDVERRMAIIEKVLFDFIADIREATHE